MTVTRHLPLRTLCSLTRGKVCSSVRVAADAIEGEVSGVDEAKVTTALEGGMGLSPIVDPSFIGSATDRVGGPALVL